MGVIASKRYNNTPLLNLCKERKDLIRAARDARYHLARSHLLYFRSLSDLSNSLNQFVHKKLIVIPFSSDDDSSSTDLICCSSDSDSDSDSDRLVCDRSQIVPLSDNEGHNPRKAASGDGTCGSSKYVLEGIKNSDEGFLEFEKKVFVNAPHENETGSHNPSSFEQNIFMGHDILGLYDFVEQTQSFYIKPDQRDEVESDGFREIREREGIPDLEPATESVHDSLIRKNCKKKKMKNVKERSPVASGIDERDIKADTCNGQVTVLADNSNEIGVQETQKETEIITEQVTQPDEEVCDEAYESSSSSFSESSGLGLTDLRVVVEKINRICEKVVSNSGTPEFLDVSSVVPLGSQFKGFASKVLGSSENSMCNLQPKRGLVKENLAGSLSMTLETLYMWEKKLFAEVTIEEKLRISYDKGYKILRNLDQSGAESSEIFEAETVVNHQLSKLNVSVRAVESISMRIHKIRDEKLSFQVIEIINGFKHMWRFLAKCHHKQFLIIAKSKSCIQIVDKGSSSRKATQKVEERIRRYRESLRGYIDAHRNFIKLLNEWLNRNIMEDDETKIEAPEIFQVCSQWLREIENVDENEVLYAIEEIELKFRGLGFKQEEEVKQRLRTERLCKELEKETKDLEEIWGTSVVFPASDSATTTKMMVGPELLSLRERVRQEREKQEILMREVNDAVSMSLQECLLHVFEALEEFCFATFKAYRNIKITST